MILDASPQWLEAVLSVAYVSGTIILCLETMKELDSSYRLFYKNTDCLSFANVVRLVALLFPTIAINFMILGHQVGNDTDILNETSRTGFYVFTHTMLKIPIMGSHLNHIVPAFVFMFGALSLCKVKRSTLRMQTKRNDSEII